jgi:hypothetical protein
MRVWHESLLIQKDLSQRLAFLQYPALHRGNQRIPANEFQLHSQNPKQQIPVGGGRLGHGKLL